MSSSTAPRFLTQIQALQRFSQIEQNSIHYTLYLNYIKGESFQAIVDIQFKLNNIDSNTFLDFRTTKIHALYVNSQKVDSPVHDGLFLHLDKAQLKLGQNNVQVYYTTKYADDGNGLHSFVDTDGKQYLYSQCEAYSCNKIFPCFDQPDLKTTLDLITSCPSDWIQLFNENETQLIVGANQEQYKSLIKTAQIPEFEQFSQSVQSNVAVYPRSALLPTYLFGFIAGPFAKIPSWTANHKNLCMNLYCRESLKNYLQNYAEFIFEVTNKCMKFYEDYFETPYYFSKYDQIFCPEFNAGAMENSGLVTFNDRYVFREEVDASRLTGFTNTITHEMAHHWFGNLVTMKWWNGLWLNESFADFISHYCISKLDIKTRPLSNVWLTFNLRKGWGYRTDQLNTTHPIEGQVPDTEAADNIFDGITYSKGAATLRQLMCLIGEENFGKAMGHYFNKYAWKNTELNDFIECLQVFFQNMNLGFTLQEWKVEWLETAGLNEIQPIFNPSDLSNSAILQVKMTPALENHATLRRHKIQVAFFRENGQIVVQDALLQGKELNEIVYDGSQGFKAVMLNYGDQAFVKLLLDDISLEFYKTNLHLIQDELTRTLIWRSFFDMVRDGKLSTEEYVDIFTNAIIHETSDENIKTQYLYIESSLLNLTPLKYQDSISKRLFDFSLQFLLKTDPSNSNRMFIIRDKLISFARDSESIKILVQWYNKTHTQLLKYPLGLENQWSIVSKVNKKKEFSNEEKDAIYKNQAELDPSDTAKNTLIKCKAYRADQEQLVLLWNEYVNPNLENPTMSVKTLDYSQAGFNNSDNLELLKPFYSQWWDVVVKVFNTQPIERAKSFFYNLYPRSDDVDYLEQNLNKLLTQCSSDQTTLIKLINESIDDTQRKRRCYLCFQQRANLASKKYLPNL